MGIGNNAKAGLGIDKTFASGLNLSQEAVYNDEGESDYGIRISYPLFTGVPTKLKQSYFQQEQKFLQAENDLNSIKEEKITNWLKTYLQILRLAETIKISELHKDAAVQNYKESKILYKDSQISEIELKESEAELIEAKNNYSTAKNQYNNTVNLFKLNLKLAEKTKLNLKNKKFLAEIESKLINPKEYSFAKMYSSLLSSDYDLKSAAVNLELQKKQLEWFEKEGKLDINLSGSYNNSTEKSVIGISFNYDLFDGGQQELNQKKLKEGLNLAVDNLENLKENKSLSLENQLNSLKSAQIRAEKAALKLENAKNKFDLAAERFELNFLSQKEFKQQKAIYKNSQNNYQKAEDELLIEKLKLTTQLNNRFSNFYNKGDK